MSTSKIVEKAPILVEFALAPGVHKVVFTPANLAEKSSKAVEGALSTIHSMGEKVVATIERLTKVPSEVEVSFGIKFDAESGAIIAKAGVEASISVKLTWKRPNGKSK